MEGQQLGVLCGNSRFEFPVTAELTIRHIFEHIKAEGALVGESGDYVLLHRNGDSARHRVIDDTLISVLDLMIDQGEICMIVNSMDSLFIEAFLERIMPSMVAEVSSLMSKCHEMVRMIHRFNTMAREYSDENVRMAVFSMLPFELLDEAGDDIDAKVAVLARWFQKDFFTFVHDEIPCRLCNSKAARASGMSTMVTPEEASYQAHRVEVFVCETCGARTRMPRYNDVRKLLETRRGRCGEFTNCFAAILSSCDIDCRLIQNMQDHVWVEYWSEKHQRYIHVDPCENAIDKPLVYETGWGHRLSLVIAVNQYQCVDVTRRYTQHMDTALRSRSELIPDQWDAKCIPFLNATFMEQLGEEGEEIRIRQRQDDLSMQHVRTEVHTEEHRGRISGSS